MSIIVFKSILVELQISIQKSGLFHSRNVASKQVLAPEGSFVFLDSFCSRFLSWPLGG